MPGQVISKEIELTKPFHEFNWGRTAGILHEPLAWVSAVRYEIPKAAKSLRVSVEYRPGSPGSFYVWFLYKMEDIGLPRVAFGSPDVLIPLEE